MGYSYGEEHARLSPPHKARNARSVHLRHRLSRLRHWGHPQGPRTARSRGKDHNHHGAWVARACVCACVRCVVQVWKEGVGAQKSSSSEERSSSGLSPRFFITR